MKMLEEGITKITHIIFILTLVFFISISAQAKYSGGSGEPNNPYQISEPNDWVELMNTSADWDKSFLMSANVDLNGVYLTPVGNNTTTFTGIFDGNDFIISNAEVNMPDIDYVGLFGYVGDNGQISNLSLDNIKISGSWSVGGLVGYNNDGITTNCCSTGKISGRSYVGGLVGCNIGTVNNCLSYGQVSGEDFLGGLVGNNYGDVNNCSCVSSVSGTWHIGGLTGSNSGNVNTSCGNSKITGERNVGGLTGRNYFGTITQSCSMGTAAGIRYVGGLVGLSYGDVNNCYSTSKVDGEIGVGGLMGSNTLGTVLNCYSTGKVSGESLTGGLMGENKGDVNDYNCFWDAETSGMLISHGGTSKTTSAMQDTDTYLDGGWDFISETVNGPNDIWWILEGKDYPRLWWQLPVDDFNDCNAAPLWLVYETEPELAHLEEIHGRLEVITAGALEDIDALYIPYNWGLDANRPFAVQVDFHFSKIGEGDGRINIGLVPSMDPSAMKWAEFEAGTFDDKPFYLYEIRDAELVQEETCDRFSDEGTLYISYDPNSDTLYFSNIDYSKKEAIWTVTGMIRSQWQCESLYIFLSGGSEDGMALTGEDAWLDNFKVCKGTLRQ